MGRRRLVALVLLIAVAATVVVVALESRRDPPGTQLPFRDRFDGPDGLISNQYATFTRASDTSRSSAWTVQSGSLLRHDGAAWTGVPSTGTPNADSSNGTGSAIFRTWTKAADFGDVQITMSLRNEGYVRGDASWPAKSWDGVKLWLRRESGQRSPALYTAEVNRRQGNVLLQKKCRDSTRYTILAQTRATRPARIHEWERVGGTIRTALDGSVTLEAIRGRTTVLTATDTGLGGCPPIAAPGHVGVRGDNVQFSFDDFTVTALGKSS